MLTCYEQEKIPFVTTVCNWLESFSLWLIKLYPRAPRKTKKGWKDPLRVLPGRNTYTRYLASSRYLQDKKWYGVWFDCLFCFFVVFVCLFWWWFVVVFWGFFACFGLVFNLLAQSSGFQEPGSNLWLVSIASKES